MVKYNCEKCGKEFTQKGQYTKHINRKNPCVLENKNDSLKNNENDKSKDKDITLVRQEGLDKFYTLPSYSKKCIDKVV